ncbi:MAG: TetR family transcriptional regulator [Planctomycetes bacterium]|nr:TetR family transcriptional regulator [Planctomycetota bacterium]
MPRRPDSSLRGRLIEAATADFAAHGYRGASLDGIGARAGVTKGAVYCHFAGKEELFYAVLDHWRDKRRRLLQVQAAGPGGAATALRAFLAGYLRFHFREPAATHLLRVQATELRGGFTARLREDERQELRWLRAKLRELLVHGVRDGTLGVEDAATTAFVLAAAVRGALEQWQASPTDVETHCDEAQLAAQLVARFATGADHERADGGVGDFDFRGGAG